MSRFFQWLKAPEIRWAHHSNTRNGVTWDCWREMDLVWRWCVPGYEEIYYDQPFRIFKFGFFSVCVFWNTDYIERHREYREAGR